MGRLAVATGMAALGLAAPAWAATSDVQVRNNSFSPSLVTVAPGDTVRWTFAGPDLNHSVTSEAGQAESFDSDPGNPSPFHAPGDRFEHTFNTPGTFRYFCKVHSFMRGRVVVEAPGGAPAGDTAAPVVSALRVRGGRTCRRKPRRCRKRPTRVRFRLSEAATVRIELERSRGRSPRPVTVERAAGRRRVKLPLRRVRRGRYRLELVATDAAGNESPALTRRFRVR